MEYRSRRERREAERAGLSPAELASAAVDQSVSANAAEDTQSVSTEQKSFPSRRELRNQENKNFEPIRKSTNLEPENETIPEDSHHSDVASTEGVSDSQADNVPDQQDTGAEGEATDEPMTAKSYLYQESSNTYTMDSIPDSLTSTNGDLVVTNSESISVVTGSHPSLSSIMDDLKYDSADQKDTVAGKISLVDPVSAKLVAESREPEVVVPGKIVVRNRAVSLTFAILGGIMFVLAGIGLWWALSEMGPFSS